MSDIRALFAALRFFRPGPAGKTVFKGFGSLAILLDENGDPAATHSRQQEIHRKHFQAQEAGEVASRTKYATLPALVKPAASYALADLPTLAGVEACIRQAQDGKAPGPSGAMLTQSKIESSWQTIHQTKQVHSPPVQNDTCTQ